MLRTLFGRIERLEQRTTWTDPELASVKSQLQDVADNPEGPDVLKVLGEIAHRLTNYEEPAI